MDWRFLIQLETEARTSSPSRVRKRGERDGEEQSKGGKLSGAETTSFVGRALLFLLLCCCRLVALVSPLAPAAGYLSADGTYNRLRNTQVGSSNLEVSCTI